MKYKCGHKGKIVILDDNLLSISAWLEWKDSVGFNGDRSQCFDCFIKDLKN